MLGLELIYVIENGHRLSNQWCASITQIDIEHHTSHKLSWKPSTDSKLQYKSNHYTQFPNIFVDH